MKKAFFYLFLVLTFLFISSCGKKKKKNVSPQNNRVNITFVSSSSSPGPCIVNSSFFNKLRITMEIGTLNASNQVVWDDSKKQVYQPDASLTCCSYPFAVPTSGDYVVRFTVVHKDCLPCCSNGKPLYVSEIINPGWGDNSNKTVELRFSMCIPC